MKKMTLLLAAVLPLMISCNQADGAKADPAAEQMNSEEVLAATIEEVLSNPGEFDGKEVALTGMVTHVCRHGGQKCFLLAGDGETQLRINVGGDIDEFDPAMEGSTVEFKGIFRILTETQTTELQQDHESKAHHENEMAHTSAEKASYFVEAVSYKEISD